MSRRSSVGLDRRVDLAWLDAAAAQASQGASGPELREALWDFFDGILPGEARGSARQKTISVLNHVWGDVPDEAQGLKARALARLTEVSPEERLALHWAMLVGTYPIFADIASSAGRLLALQESFSLSLLTRRLFDSWGERSTVARAAQRVLRSMVQWGALRDGAERGTYLAGFMRSVSAQTTLVLLEAQLVDTAGAGLTLAGFSRSSANFPFRTELDGRLVREAKHFDVHRQGLDDDFVTLR